LPGRCKRLFGYGIYRETTYIERRLRRWKKEGYKTECGKTPVIYPGDESTVPLRWLGPGQILLTFYTASVSM